jgi:hypothetical protein
MRSPPHAGEPAQPEPVPQRSAGIVPQGLV